MNVLIGDTIFMSPAGDRTAILGVHQSHAKLFAGQRQYFHFSVMLRYRPLCTQALLATELILCCGLVIQFILFQREVQCEFGEMDQKR